MHLHKWSKWEQYEQNYHDKYLGVVDPVEYWELREKRYCTICNKMQDRKVRRK